jgi:D-beta-D-heptose 7-phosphate kinase/D-beta-D-heptose 1-phosphate adenosyltransferase
MSEEKIIVAVSGGFDPIHIGHVRMLQDAKELGDELVVILNNDNWLRAKKGTAFMPENERKELLEALEVVDRIAITRHEPGTTDFSVCHVLEEVQPHIFANGGDRKPDGDPVPEVELCERLGINMVYNIGRGGKVQSSSWLTADDREERDCFCESGKRYIDCHGKS